MRMTEHTFMSWDGVEIFYRAWVPEGGFENAVMLFHRGHEHSGRWGETVERLGLENVAVFAWDQRGHGKSAGKRGHAESLTGVVKDADWFVRHLVNAHGVKLERTAVVGSSFGGVIAAAWVHDFGAPVCGLVLAAPAFRLKLYVPLAIPMLRMKEKFLPGGEVKSYVKSHMLTHDRAQAAAYDADPLIFKQIAVNMVLDLHDMAGRVVADAGVITTPTLLLAAEKDWVVKLSAQQEFFGRLGSRVKQMEVMKGFGHSLFHEAERGKVVERVGGFLRECFARPCACGELVKADVGGATRTEYDMLRMPGGFKWKLARLNLRTFAKLSAGVRRGWATGFDSGATLDYVYENKARGTALVGKVVDYFYLNAIGWRGIRVRRRHLETMLRSVMERLSTEGRRVHVMDIAAGMGRYVVETMRGAKHVKATALLRDYRRTNLDGAAAMAGALGVQGVEVAEGDAFDRVSLSSVNPKPTVGIASGIYELFPENACVLESLKGIAGALEEGGYLIYTCQPWHPQVELIARTLVNREGNPWVMRRRSQAEMDALVRAAGFEKLEQEIDRWGIFTVSVARKVGA
jgi:alpha-beta hydrolase superfamily lysophospholipase